MAYVVFTNGQHRMYTTPGDIQRLVQVWRVKTGLQKTANPALKAYCQRVKQLRFNWYEAPEDYIRHNLSYFVERAMSDWVVDAQGKPVRPASSEAWAFAKKYGLWKAKQPTRMVIDSQQRLI